jgi:hypothetical protein
MARGLGMTALRVALGGVAGYGQDVAIRRERERLEAERARELARQEAADVRQRELDRIGMLDKGYMTPEAQGAAKRTGGAAVLRAALTGARDQATIDQGLSAAAPQQTTTFGGQQYTRETPFAKAAREASRALYEEQQKEQRTRREKQTAIDEQVKALVATGDYTEAQARAAVVGGVGAYAPLTKAQRADFALRGRQIALAERNAAQGGTGGQPGGTKKQPVSKTSLQQSLPNVIEFADELNAMKPTDVARLRPSAMDLTSVTQRTPGGTGFAQRLAQGMVYPPTDTELRYIQMANATADAVARATDVGVLSNFDIERFRYQVTPTVQDSPQAMQQKFRVLQQWANWLASNRQTLAEADAAYEAGKPAPNLQLRAPGESDEEYTKRLRGANMPPAMETRAGGGDAELTRARNAIAGGAPRNRVIQVYEQRTGNKWPGG